MPSPPTVLAERRSNRPRTRLRIALIGPARFGVTEPFVGGLESHTAATARALQRAGHVVTVFAGPATEPAPPDLDVVPIVDALPASPVTERHDIDLSPSARAAIDLGYARVLAYIAADAGFDVVHNNSLHTRPVDEDGSGPTPIVHVLHCPPYEELRDAHRRRRRTTTNRTAVVAVSHSLARQWSGLVDDVVANGIPLADFTSRAGGTVGDHCVWAGRLVEEKAPHLAIDAARRAGRRIVLAGPALQPRYFDRELRPRLGDDAEWVGHLDHHELSELFASGAVGIMTPRWEEPFGLVAAEMLAAGTPLAAFDRGALRAVTSPEVAAFAPADDVARLADAIARASTFDRPGCQAFARAHLSDDRMVADYTALYLDACRSGPTRQPRVRLVPA